MESDPNSAFANEHGPHRAWTQQVIDRRIGRRTCICPRAERPQDQYVARPIPRKPLLTGASFEPGTNRLFDDRADQEFPPNNLVDGLPRQKPDRIVGLRATTNIKELLEHPLHDRFGGDEIRLGSRIRTSPFAWQPEPMIFPFLVLEAKSDSTKSGFVDIQTQSAFPIRSLLELQRNLQSIQGEAYERPAPLVWFLGNRGSIWKVYGCYVSFDERDRVSYVGASKYPLTTILSLANLMCATRISTRCGVVILWTKLFHSSCYSWSTRSWTGLRTYSGRQLLLN